MLWFVLGLVLPAKVFLRFARVSARAHAVTVDISRFEEI